MPALSHFQVLAGAAFFLALSLVPAAHSAVNDAADTWVLKGGKIYQTPDQPPIVNGAILIRGNRIVAVGKEGSFPVPAGARASACSGPVLTAGFYNSHVHFIDPAWDEAATQPAGKLTRQLVDMLTRHGFTTVVDIASDRDNTLALQQRIHNGDVPGPRLHMVGLPLFPPKGLPVYLDHLSPAFRRRLPQPETPAEAVKVVQENFANGVVGTKLFIASPRLDGLRRMPADIASAAARETHRRGGVVLAHPTDIEGVEAALAANVDILAHTTLGVQTPWPAALHKQAVERGMSLIPTLKLMAHELAREKVPPSVWPPLVTASVAHVRDFVAAGGDVLFGTDVGYMNDTDPTAEYELMAQAGLSPMQILASLTTRPATKWKDATHGRLASGMTADIVVLYADPVVNPANFSKVRCTIGAGRVLFDGTKPAPIAGK